MTAADIIIFVLIIAGIGYGLMRGIRPTLSLLIAFLLSMIAMMFLTLPLESLMIRLAGLGEGEAYKGAPAVAVFILEGEDTLAYTAALIPGFLTLAVLILFGILAGIGKRFLTEPSGSVASRLWGAFGGILVGVVLSVIFAVQLVRLPRPLAGSMFRGSLILNLLNSTADYLLPTLAGGISGV